MKKFLSVTLAFTATLLILSACSAVKTQTAATPTAQAASGLIAEGSLLPVKALDQSFTVAGRVAEVLVKDGDSVQSGAVLARLGNSANAQLALAQAEQEAIDAQQALDNVKNSNAASTNAELTLAQAQTAYNTALGNYWNRNKTQGSTDLITVTRAKLQLLDNQIGDLQDNYNNMAELSDSDTKKTQTLQNLSQARIDRAALQKQLNYYETNPDAQEVQTLKAKLDVAKTNLEDAQRTYTRMQNGIDPNTLASAQARVDTATASVASAQSALDALELKAGMSGTVVDINLLPGQQISAGQTLMSVADFSQWVVETDNLTEAEVVNLKVGQKVEVVLDALPDVPLAGEVTHINNRFEVKRGDVTYTVTVTLTQTDPRMRWGMTAAVKFGQN